MSTSTHPITIISDYDIEDAFSSKNTPDYTLALPDYFPASPRNTSSDHSEDLSNNESPIPLPRAPIAPPTVLPPSLVLSWPRVLVMCWGRWGSDCWSSGSGGEGIKKWGEVVAGMAGNKGEQEQ
nr:hypothetical protein [Tanacetum cinerariifolium]